MAYRKTKISQYRGRYHRTLGKVIDADGRVVPKKFLLGTDRAAAEVASRLLEQLWDAVIAEHAAAVGMLPMVGEWYEGNPITGEADFKRLRDLSKGPVWRVDSLVIAEAIRKGEREVLVSPSKDQSPFPYVERVAWLKKMYPVIAFVPACREWYAEGRYNVQASAEELAQQARDYSVLAKAAALDSTLPPAPKGNDRTLHEALEAYALHALQQTDKEYGQVEAAAARRLKRSHPDIPLSAFNVSAMERITAYWRSRPPAEKTGEPIKLGTVTNHLKVARRFVRWLDRASDFPWDKPKGAEEALRTNVARLRTDEEVAALSRGVPIWSIAELAVMYEYATEFERLLILLGLNCGFAQSEVMTLRRDEVHRQGGVVTIKRMRRKSVIYGEFELWPETAAAIDRFTAKRDATTQRKSPYVLVTREGRPYVRQRIANLWNRLRKRLAAGEARCRPLSFKFLRKTAGQLVRDRSDGEVMAVFHCRSKAVATDNFADAYTNRPFHKVTEALRKVRKDLEPVFAAARETVGAG